MTDARDTPTDAPELEELESLLQPLLRPLRFARRAGDAGLKALQGFEAHAARGLERLRAAAGARGVRGDLERLYDLLVGFDALTRDEQRARVDAALAILEALAGQASDAAPAPPTTRTTTAKTTMAKTTTTAKTRTTAAARTTTTKTSAPADVAPADDADPLAQPLTVLKGVGPKLAERLAARGLVTVRDALFFLPRDYEDRRTVQPLAALVPGEVAAVEVEILALGRARGLRGRPRLEMVVSDGSGTAAAVWFRGFQGLETRYQPGDRVRLAGRVQRFRGRLQFSHPDLEPLDRPAAGEGRALLPRYPEIEGLRPRALRRLLRQAAERFASAVPETLPARLQARLALVPLAEAIREVHQPPADADLAALRDGRSPAHRRMVFDEFFALQVGLALRRRQAAAEPGIAFDAGAPRVERLRARLPFQLTGAQERAVGEIFADMERPQPMNRLLQGDVGSGKTLVALCAALKAIDAGYQAAIMAPTEILAEQHRRTAEAVCADLDVSVSLLVGKLKRSQRSRREEWLASGVTDLVIGTHALVQQGVEFHDLGLAVVDEQHRFGVLQRTALRGKGRFPDVLVMTATPIPRTLALTVYGDLDTSVLDELPPGRQPVVTRVFDGRERAGLRSLIREEVGAGRQVYVVYPQVEESEKTDLADATSGAADVATAFPEFTVGLVHGRLRPEQKAATMEAFRRGECQILVCTTVIEVGLDVPNATVMVVEHAERFGLSQLHQLRGRVGRGGDRSYCLLVARGEQTEEGRRRLAALEESTDGFRISEVDLELRGPGELLGTRQAGLPDFLLASAVRHPAILSEAREEAFRLVAQDPDLARPEHRSLRRAIRERWADRLDLVEVG